MQSVEETLCVVLAGGVGTRLHPLTADRAKPAVPFGGEYRIIDFTLTNCLHSGLRRILVLTQYKSHSLQKHLRDGWTIFNPELGEYVTALPPQMRTDESWYCGTADAIHQNLYIIERSPAKRVIILSGDHIYRMDYAAMLEFHENNHATVTVGCMEVARSEASSFGVMAVDDERRIVDFEEKPADPRSLPDDPNRSLVSMGIYIFDRELLCRELTADHDDPESSHDFGRDLLPRLIESERVFAYRFGGPAGRVSADRYWRDVGTIDAYYDANMDLLKPKPPLDLYQDNWSIRTYHPQHPPARMVPGPSGFAGDFVDSIVSSGSVSAGGSVSRSILGRRVRVEEHAVVDASILFDGVRVGSGARLRKCIVDKNVTIPAGTTIGFDPEADAERFHVSESGVVVVPKEHSFEMSPMSETTNVEFTAVGNK